MRPKALILMPIFCLLLLWLTAGHAQRLMAHAGAAPVSARPHPASFAAPQTGPALSIAAGQVVTAGQAIQVPIAFQSNGHAIAAMIFSVDFDEQCLALDPTDQNQDGRPDAISWQLPAGQMASVVVDLSDSDGELDFTIADYFPPFIVVPDRAALVTLTLNTTCQPAPGTSITAAVAFSTGPAPSFGSTSGASVAGSATDGSVIIHSSTPEPTMTPTATTTVLPTLTPTLVATVSPATTPTPTATPTLIPTAPSKTMIEDFNVAYDNNRMVITWRTSSEIDSAGFYLYRLANDGGLNFYPVSVLIPAHGPGLYQFTDSTALACVRYTYLLVERKNDGRFVEYDELLPIIGLNTDCSLRHWLPLVYKK
ncbi:MAG: hypothetical protein DYG89_39800 [Caldilinea sp. CFX5]|nr:hypothetical protein [Caldilinea sp. CFX5]